MVAAEEQRRLKTIFPQGVCGLLKNPGVKQKALAGTWIDFTDGAAK